MTKKEPLNKDDLKLFKDCPRCFFLAYKHSINRPNFKKKLVVSEELSEDDVKIIKKLISKGLPLQSEKCTYCIYRQLVRETGIENELTA